MAYQFSIDLVETIRQSPLRAALAMVLLITTTVYVCTGHDGYRVTEMGDADSSLKVVDLTSGEGWDEEEEVDLISADEEDAPALSTRDGDRDQYIDAQLTHAVAAEDETAASQRQRVTPVSGERERLSPEEEPVWLLGVLNED